MEHRHAGQVQAELTLLPRSVVTSTEQREIIDLCSAAFEEDYAPYFRALGTTSMHVLARLAGRLVAHACWVTRWLQPEGLPQLRTAYVEGVVVGPALQRRGLGSHVMRRVAAEIQGYELGALATGSVSFYARLGWELWQGPTAIRTAEGLQQTPGERPMILRTRLTPPLDSAVLLTAEWRAGELW